MIKDPSFTKVENPRLSPLETNASADPGQPKSTVGAITALRNTAKPPEGGMIIGARCLLT